MTIITRIKNLFIEPALFFENPKAGLKIPFLITFCYAVISAVCSIPALQAALSVSNTAGIPIEDMKTVMIGGSLISAFFMAFVAWIGMSILFFIALKLFAKPSLSFKDVMNVTSYGAIPLAVVAIIQGLITLVGTPYQGATLILSGATLFLTVPIWVKGFEAFGAGPEKKVLTAVIAGAVITGVIGLISNLGTMMMA